MCDDLECPASLWCEHYAVRPNQPFADYGRVPGHHACGRFEMTELRGSYER